jgi:F0F1-type ATP synthase assembly protein I
VQQNWKGIGTYSTVGLEFAGCALLGLLVGRWLDQKFETGTKLAFVGLAFGLVAGFRAIWRALKQANAEAERMDEEERRARKDFHDKDPR